MKYICLVISLFSEKKCYACWQVGHFFCYTCQQKLYKYKPYCYVCKQASENFQVHPLCQEWFPLQQVIVATRYRQDAVKKALKHAKYYGKYILYEDILHPYDNFLQQYIWEKERAVLIPVPMNFFRKWKRGYNQSQKIAEYLSIMLNIPINNNLILRKSITKHQSHLSREERLNNLSWAFQIQAHTLPLSTPLYLIDDVISTGATIGEIAKVLSQAGFTDIRAIVIASD